jgi:hypothetical protein
MRAPLFSAPQGRQRIFELSWILAIVPLIFPHQQFYAFAFQLPAVACVLYHCFLTGGKLRLVIPLVIVFLAFNLQLLLGEFTKFYEHFKMVTFGGLITLVLLWVSRRSFAERSSAKPYKNT